MFWQSISLGLAVLGQIPVLIPTILVMLFYMGYLMLIRIATGARENIDAAGPGCLTQVIGLLFQGILMALFVLLLLPVLLGISSQISWWSVEPLGFVAARSGILATFMVTLLSFFPWLGPLLASSPGLEAFLMATLTFRFLSPLYLEGLLGKGVPIKDFFPGLWQNLGYLFLALLMTRLLMEFMTSLANYLGRKAQAGPRWEFLIKKFLGPSIDMIGGILPFFMYAQWVRLNLP